MEEQVRKGHTKSIGLSNFNEKQVLSIWENAQIKPSNLQVSIKCTNFIILKCGKYFTY